MPTSPRHLYGSAYRTLRGRTRVEDVIRHNHWRRYTATTHTPGCHVYVGATRQQAHVVSINVPAVVAMSSPPPRITFVAPTRHATSPMIRDREDDIFSYILPDILYMRRYYIWCCSSDDIFRWYFPSYIISFFHMIWYFHYYIHMIIVFFLFSLHIFIYISFIFLPYIYYYTLHIIRTLSDPYRRSIIDQSGYWIHYSDPSWN
jgi:hypothetical protein